MTRDALATFWYPALFGAGLAILGGRFLRAVDRELAAAERRRRETARRLRAAFTAPPSSVRILTPATVPAAASPAPRAERAGTIGAAGSGLGEVPGAGSSTSAASSTVEPSSGARRSWAHRDGEWPSAEDDRR